MSPTSTADCIVFRLVRQVNDYYLLAIIYDVLLTLLKQPKLHRVPEKRPAVFCIYNFIGSRFILLIVDKNHHGTPSNRKI